jgi:hypothetical protein
MSYQAPRHPPGRHTRLRQGEGGPRHCELAALLLGHGFTPLRRLRLDHPLSSAAPSPARHGATRRSSLGKLALPVGSGCNVLLSRSLSGSEEWQLDDNVCIRERLLPEVALHCRHALRVANSCRETATEGGRHRSLGGWLDGAWAIKYSVHFCQLCLGALWLAQMGGRLGSEGARLTIHPPAAGRSLSPALPAAPALLQPSLPHTQQ